MIVDQAASRKPPPLTNDSLRIVTWCSTLCAGSVQEAILDALEADLQGASHPLTAPARAMRPLIQGAGRVVSGKPQLRRLFEYLSKRPPNMDVMNALGTALSRREGVGQALTSELFDRLVLLTINELKGLREKRSYKLRLMETLRAAVGLLRYREFEPFALVIGISEAATELDLILERIYTEIMISQRGVPQAASKLRIVAELRELLKGKGDPRLLRQIEELDEDDDVEE